MNAHKHTMSDLYQMQGMPLDVKVKMTLRRIQEWYEAYNGNVYVSFSGGKDSTVLLDLARHIYPDMKAVFFNTGIEHPSVIRFVKTIPNTIIIKPKKTFISIIKRYGYPIVSKENALVISEARNKIRQILKVEPYKLGGVQNC